MVQRKKSSNERRFLLRKRISFLSFVSFSFFFFSFLLFLFLFFLPLFLPPFLPLFLPLSLLLFFFFPFFLFDFFPLFSPFPLRRGAPLGRGALGSAYCAYRLFRPSFYQLFRFMPLNVFVSIAAVFPGTGLPKRVFEPCGTVGHLASAKTTI